METATLAGGCFWCTEAIFKRLKGIKSVTSGYAEEALKTQVTNRFQVAKPDTPNQFKLNLIHELIHYEKILEVFLAYS